MQYLHMSSLMSRSAGLNLGPVLYQPMIFSRAAAANNRSSGDGLNKYY